MRRLNNYNPQNKRRSKPQIGNKVLSNTVNYKQNEIPQINNAFSNKTHLESSPKGIAEQIFEESANAAEQKTIIDSNLQSQNETPRIVNIEGEANTQEQQEQEVEKENK